MKTAKPTPNSYSFSGGTAKGWKGCKSAATCSAAQIKIVNAYRGSFMQAVLGRTRLLKQLNESKLVGSPTTAQRAGNGAFVDSCLLHCEATQDKYWRGIRSSLWVDGVRSSKAGSGLSMKASFLAWWRSDGEQPAAQFESWPCTWGVAGAKGKPCNPTCKGK